MKTELQQLVAALPPERITHASRLGLSLAPRLKTEEWRGLIARISRLAHAEVGKRQTLTAWLGDALAYGEAGGRGMIGECAAAAGLHVGTLRNAKMVCGRIPVACRHDALSWTHHCEVGLAFADAGEIERWLVLAEAERLSTAELRRRVRAHVAGLNRPTAAGAIKSSVAVYRLLRELRAVSRSLAREADGWQPWSPAVAQLALQELGPLADFVDAVRVCARAGGPSAAHLRGAL